MLWQNVQPDVGIFNSMIAACAHGGEFSKARHMFESMAEHGCEPDAVTYANLIRAFKKGGQWCASLTACSSLRVDSLIPAADSVMSFTMMSISSCRRQEPLERLQLFVPHLVHALASRAKGVKVG